MVLVLSNWLRHGNRNHLRGMKSLRKRSYVLSDSPVSSALRPRPDMCISGPSTIRRYRFEAWKFPVHRNVVPLLDVTKFLFFVFGAAVEDNARSSQSFSLTYGILLTDLFYVTFPLHFCCAPLVTSLLHCYLLPLRVPHGYFTSRLETRISSSECKYYGSDRPNPVCPDFVRCARVSEKTSHDPFLCHQREPSVIRSPSLYCGEKLRWVLVPRIQ